LPFKNSSKNKIDNSFVAVFAKNNYFYNCKDKTFQMGRKKFTQKEYNVIRKLLGSKMRGNRAQQKMVRHTLRTVFEFNISDFNIQGQAFGPADLDECLRRGRIQVLDDATIEAMKLRHAEKRLHDEAVQQAEAIADGETVDWQKVLEEWNEYYKNNPKQ
jgi:hypothetical protein